MVYKKEEQTVQNSRYFTVIQVAKMMGITRGAVYKQIAKGQIDVEDIHGRLLIPMKGVERRVAIVLTEKIKKEIDKGVEKAVREYGETLKMLGKE